MDRKIPRVCFVIALILASTLLPVSASSAETRETPRAAMRASTDWLGSALVRLDGLLAWFGGRERNGSSSTRTKEEAYGVCIDPQGRPYYCPNPPS
jgi:hypothetical protein